MPAKLGQIDFGEDDANVEHFQAFRSSVEPAYVRSFVNINNDDYKKIKDGRKWIVYGLKGTGKTAILRNISETKGVPYEYVVFRDEIDTEEDLSQEAFPFVINESEIHNKRHYIHIIKRIILSIIISKYDTSSEMVKSLELGLEDAGALKNLVKKLAGRSATSVLDEVFNSVSDVFSALKIDASKLLPDGISVNAAKLLKRQNNRMIEEFILSYKKDAKPIDIYIDEVHFSYKDENSYRSDAALVRDIIKAADIINNRFLKERIDITVYVGIRAEFLEHPIIRSAEIMHVVNASAQQMLWSTYRFDDFHPCFEVIAARINSSCGTKMRGRDVRKTYLPNMSADQFLRGVYGKPRDSIRFFKLAGQMYPEKVTLDNKDQAAVYRAYSNLAWADMQASISSFLPEASVNRLVALLKGMAANAFNTNITVEDAAEQLRDVWELGDVGSSTHDFDHFMHVLYVIGLYQTKFDAPNGQVIYHSYYRGNFNPSSDATFLLSDAVIRHFA